MPLGAVKASICPGKQAGRQAGGPDLYSKDSNFAASH
jgi:hypothetical protein